MVPALDLEGGLPLAIARAMSVAALLSVFGSLVFHQAVAGRAFARMPPAADARIGRTLQSATQCGVAIGIVAMLGWLALQTAEFAGATALRQVAAALPAVVEGTDFGRLIAGQIALFLLIAVMLGRREHPHRQWIALALAAAATALQAGHSHAAAMFAGPSLLLGSDVLHLLAAGAWLGGLLPLLLLVTGAPVSASAAAAMRFSPLGQICIVALVVTAAFQGWVMIGGVAGLVGTPYGRVALLKLCGFGVLVVCAIANRTRFAPALLRGNPLGAKRAFVTSIVVEIGVGLAIVGAAAVLSAMAPAMHLQPDWPFPKQISLDAVREDPDLRLEAIEGAAGLGGAVALLVLAALVRRIRWPGAALAVVVAWLALPHLGLLLADATPTSFYHSPTGFAATSIVAGAALYPTHCAVCHGVSGHGDGPGARGLPVPPADLTADHVLEHSDGQMFGWLARGIATPEGVLVMPGVAGVLSDDQRWALIDFVRAANAGARMRSTGAWGNPAQAPGFQAVCGDRTVMLSDLRGKFVRLVIGTVPAAPANPDVVTVTTGPPPDPATCVVDGGGLAAAYAIVSGKPADGMQFLIDGDGWLRGVQANDAVESWNDPKLLAAAVRQARAHPLAAPGGDMMNMRM